MNKVSTCWNTLYVRRPAAFGATSMLRSLILIVLFLYLVWSFAVFIHFFHLRIREMPNAFFLLAEVFKYIHVFSKCKYSIQLKVIKSVVRCGIILQVWSFITILIGNYLKDTAMVSGLYSSSSLKNQSQYFS